MNRRKRCNGWVSPPLVETGRAGGDGLQAAVQAQAGGLERRRAIIGQSAADRGTVPLHELGLDVLAAFDLTFGRPDGADLLLQFLLGMAVGFADRQCRLAQIVELAELMRHLRQHFLDRQTDRGLAVADHADDRDLQVLHHLA